MFTVNNEWVLVAAIFKAERNESLCRIYIVNRLRIPLDRLSTRTLRNSDGCVCMLDVKDPVMIDDLISKGLTESQPLVLDGFNVICPSKKFKDIYPAKLGHQNSFIISKDSGFESQYHTCRHCHHPVSVVGYTDLTLLQKDEFNEGKELNLDSIRIEYRCGSCGREIEEIIKDVRVVKTINGRLELLGSNKIGDPFSRDEEWETV